MSTPPDSPIDPSGLRPPKLPQVVSGDEEEKDSIAVSSDCERGSSANEFYGVKSDEDISESVDNDSDDSNDDNDDGKDDDSDDSEDDDSGPPSKRHHVDISSENGGGPDDDDVA
nr:calsequestrin-1-like [Setaria viridis]